MTRRTVRIGQGNGVIGEPEEVEMSEEQAALLDTPPQAMGMSAHGLPPERIAELKERSRRIFETNEAPFVEEARRRGMLPDYPAPRKP